MSGSAYFTASESHLKIPVDDVVNFEVIIVFAKRVQDYLRDFYPPNVEEELEYGHDRDVEIHLNGTGSICVVVGRHTLLAGISLSLMRY